MCPVHETPRVVRLEWGLVGGEHSPVKLTFPIGPGHQAIFVSVLFVVPKIMAREEKAGQALGRFQETLIPWGLSLNFVPSHYYQVEP